MDEVTINIDNDNNESLLMNKHELSKNKCGALLNLHCKMRAQTSKQANFEPHKPKRLRIKLNDETVKNNDVVRLSIDLNVFVKAC